MLWRFRVLPVPIGWRWIWGCSQGDRLINHAEPSGAEEIKHSVDQSLFRGANRLLGQELGHKLLLISATDSAGCSDFLHHLLNVRGKGTRVRLHSDNQHE